MASVGFRWLDILEKEFDKAFVDLDLAIGVLDLEEPDVVYNVRQKLCTLSSCFAQLTHKAQTIFQNSAKIEAELIHIRAELVESKAKREILEQELHNLLLQLHSSQLAHLPGQLANRKQEKQIEPDINNIKKKLENELRRSSPTNLSKNPKESEELKFGSTLLELAQLKAENVQLQNENTSLRNSVLALNSEVYGAKLAAKYLDKELAGRIQQLQLLGREMRGDVRDKLWRQLESEILLQRHKTVVRACRRNSLLSSTEKICPKPDVPCINEAQSFGDIRTVVVKRKTGQGLGISITGGREHGVPILISELEPNGPAAVSGQLYIGDAILTVNDRDLRQACHREAVEILQQQRGDCELQVQYIAADDSDNSLEEDGFNFRFFDGEVCNSNDLLNLHTLNSGMMNTPTAPRTPESMSQSRPPSRDSNKTYDSENKIDNLICDNTTINISNIEPTTPNHNEHIIFTDTRTESVDNRNKTIMSVLNIKREEEINKNDEYEVQTSDLILIDNRTDNIIKLENFKKTNEMDNIEDNFNCSTNSLNSENLSSPMQTSTDVFLDSEILSTDVASTDSQSPKNIQNMESLKPRKFTYDNSLLEVKKFNEFCVNYKKSSEYISSDTFSNPKSDHSLLNSGESCDSSPVHKLNRDYKKPLKKHKPKRYFGVKTLQSIFSNHNGYSDISSTASEIGDEPVNGKIYEENASALEDRKISKKSDTSCDGSVDNVVSLLKSNSVLSETSPQFEENIHTLLSEIFIKNFTIPDATPVSSKAGKQFCARGQNLRVSKALRLCPNDDYLEKMENEQKKEKLLARYVYNANSCGGDGVGDPDFGTPV